jgi:hypothetical protein
MRGDYTYRTSTRIEADRAAALLESERIPFERGVETASGERFAMPERAVDPSDVAWLLIIPAFHADAAMELLAEPPGEAEESLSEPEPPADVFLEPGRFDRGWRWIILGIALGILLLRRCS